MKRVVEVGWERSSRRFAIVLAALGVVHFSTLGFVALAKRL